MTNDYKNHNNYVKENYGIDKKITELIEKELLLITEAKDRIIAHHNNNRENMSRITSHQFEIIVNKIWYTLTKAVEDSSRILEKNEYSRVRKFFDMTYINIKFIAPDRYDKDMDMWFGKWLEMIRTYEITLQKNVDNWLMSYFCKPHIVLSKQMAEYYKKCPPKILNFEEQ